MACFLFRGPVDSASKKASTAMSRRFEVRYDLGFGFRSSRPLQGLFEASAPSQGRNVLLAPRGVWSIGAFGSRITTKKG